jgi:hypothetical protein
VIRISVVVSVLVLALAGDAAAFVISEGPRAPGWTRAHVDPAPQPLTGTGEGMRIVANLPLEYTDGDVAASDIEMAGTHAFIGSYTEGLVIADISDPTHPRRAGVFRCGGGSQYDVQLSNDANLVLLTTDGTGASCLQAGQSGSMIIDATDKAAPRLVGFIPTAVGSHTHTLDDRTLYINNYPASYSKLEIFDLTNPSAPAKLSELSFDGEDSIHDSFVDHRPAGRSQLYAASIGYTDVIDVSDPRHPKILQRLADPSVTISHQAEPNAARDTLIVTDELAGGSEIPLCGALPVKLGEGLLPLIGDPTDTGAIHFYKLAPDGTLANGGEGPGKLGTFNLPYALNPTGGCTVHVFWQAPAENRLVTAWYGRGTHVVDFQDPSAARELAWFIPTGADTWSAKPHRVGDKTYIFTGDIVRGMDVLEYTGSGWPATAGAQELQRLAYRGASLVPAKPTTPSRPAKPVRGGVLLKRTVSVPRSRSARTTLTLSFRSRRGALVSKVRYRVRSGRRAVVRARVAALAGRYRYVLRVGDRGRVLARGTLRISKRQASSRTALGGNRLVCRIVA